MSQLRVDEGVTNTERQEKDNRDNRMCDCSHHGGSIPNLVTWARVIRTTA